MDFLLPLFLFGVDMVPLTERAISDCSYALIDVLNLLCALGSLLFQSFAVNLIEVVSHSLLDSY